MARRADRRTRANIAETALRTFGEMGFRSATIKRIAAKAAVAPGSIYTYFRDKDELFRAVVAEGWRAFLASLEAIASSSDTPSRKLTRLLDIGFGVLRERLPLVRGIVFEAGRRELLRRMIDELCERVERLFVEAGLRGAAPGLGATRAGPGRMPAGPGAPRADPRAIPAASRAHWRVMLRVTVTGIMFSAAAAPPERAEAEIRSLRSAVTALVNLRIKEASQ